LLNASSFFIIQAIQWLRRVGRLPVYVHVRPLLHPGAREHVVRVLPRAVERRHLGVVAGCRGYQVWKRHQDVRYRATRYGEAMQPVYMK